MEGILKTYYGLSSAPAMGDKKWNETQLLYYERSIQTFLTECELRQITLVFSSQKILKDPSV